MWTGPVTMVIDVVVTYMLPLFHLDIADFGDENLWEEMGRRRSRVHVLGHVHEGYGKGCFVYDCFEACYEDVCRGIEKPFHLRRDNVLSFYVIFLRLESCEGSRSDQRSCNREAEEH